jgi:hypothetical protein
LQDRFYKTTPQLEKIILDNLQRNVGPPPGDTILINGTNKNVKGGGNYNQVRLTKGKKYRLRLINMSLDNYIRVSLDKHVFQVITADFVPVKPFYTDWILISIGQRYDVVIFADQTAGNYWFRAEPATDCRSTNNFPGRAIFSYDNVTVATPTTSAANFVADCIEPLPSPFWKQPVPNGNFSSIASSLNVGLTRAQAVPGGDTVVLWALNASSMNVAWEKPTLSYIMDGNSSYPPRLNIIPILSKGNWNYWLIVSSIIFQNPSKAPLENTHEPWLSESLTSLFNSNKPLKSHQSLIPSTSTDTTSSSLDKVPPGSIRTPRTSIGSRRHVGTPQASTPMGGSRWLSLRIIPEHG